MAISFDGPNKLIILSSGTTTLSVRYAWSRWVDWFCTSDNSKYLMAFRSVGGDDIDISVGTKVPAYAYLMNEWRIKPQEANHTLSVTDGILVVDGGGDPFINTSGSYVVRINYQQPVQAISFATGGSALTQGEHDKLMGLPDLSSIETEIKEEVNAIIRDDASEELSSIPNDTAPLATQIQFLFQYFRNKRTVTNSEETMFKEDATTELGSATLSDDGTTFTKNEMA